MDERDLAQHAAKGDREAFGGLINYHQAGVYNVAYRMLGECREAEDALQEAFLRAYRAIRTLDPQRPPCPWLIKKNHPPWKKIQIKVITDSILERFVVATSVAVCLVSAPKPTAEAVTTVNL